MTKDRIRDWISFQLESDGSLIEMDGVEYIDDGERVGLRLTDVDGGVWNVWVTPTETS